MPPPPFPLLKGFLSLADSGVLYLTTGLVLTYFKKGCGMKSKEDGVPHDGFIFHARAHLFAPRLLPLIRAPICCWAHR